MIELNVSRLPGEIANVLLMCGWSVTPLKWLDKPNRTAKKILDRESEDTVLFKTENLPDESMCAAVRAMLYLLSGWRGECDMYAQASPEKERAYLAALSFRQAGEPHKAKEVLQQFETHPIYPSLAAFAIKAIGPGADRTLMRFKQIIELGEAWEPFAFVDLYEQARVGKLSSPPITTIREIQCREFELLFTHCYEAATGVTLSEESTDTTVPRKRVPKRQRPRPRQPMPEKSNQQETPKWPQSTIRQALHKPGTAGFSCPRCNHIDVLPEHLRGTKHQCSKCSVIFLIPQKKPTPAVPKT